jgi:hypothetical protein
VRAGDPNYNTPVVQSTYLKVMAVEAAVLAGLWMLQQAFL